MTKPLAERMRPKTLDEYIGQEHLVGPQGVLRGMIESGHIASFILWGPPGPKSSPTSSKSPSTPSAP